jgi:ribonuclease HIII
MAKNSYTHPLTKAQAETLRGILQERGWKFEPKEYTIFAARKDKVTVAVYEKGPKILVQGTGTEQFVEFILEPEVIGVAELGYEEVHHPEMYEPHIGVDESGKGDFYGPLVIAGVYVNPDSARQLKQSGVQDSKAISSDKRIRDLSDIIRQTPGAIHEVISIGPERYNEVYQKAGNLNRLLAWGHARVIENLLERQPDCPRALSDQFAHESVLQKALLTKGKMIQLDQRTKGESDIAVAAASILAREKFINWLEEAGKRLGVELPRGASNQLITDVGLQLIQQCGKEILPKVGKMHFRNSYRILGLPEPEKKEWRSKPKS